MLCSFVCLVFLIWCQLLNYSAATNEETQAGNVLTLSNGTLLTVRSNGPLTSNSHSPGADSDTGIEGAISTGEDAASGYRFLQKKLLEELKDYKFVTPQVLAGKKKRSVAILPQESYPDHISFSVKLEGEDLLLDLSRNSLLLPRGFQVSFYDSNGTLVTEKETEMYRCCYEGSVREFPGSKVSASICSGLSALIVFSNRSYIIEHLAGDKDGRHLLYRPEDLSPVPSSCGVKNTSPGFTLTDHLLRSRRMKRDMLTEMRYLELVLVADNAFYQNLGRDRKAVVKRLLDVANTVDMYYRPLNLRIALIGVEVWTTDQISVDRSASGTMSRFLHWRKTHLLPRLPNDSAHLVIGSFFTDGTAGLAMFGSICSTDQSGGVDTDTRASILSLSAILAHEIGHNLGIAHDTDSRNCKCTDQTAGCIMEDALGFKLPKAFSSCSQQDLQGSLLTGRGSCLYNLPNTGQLVGGPQCGNLYVETGEECDCGKPSECSDSCCEASTCKLKPGAQCSSTGACCKNCVFLPAATICRPSRGECDLPEFCTGKSSDCPVNVFLKDGHTCSNGNLYCGDGICQSADKQCQEIWGEGATSAEDLCYQVTNEEGSEFGNCGKDENDKYIKCRKQDVACGKIQCKGGGSKPIRGGNLDIVTTRMTVNGVKYVCRGTYSSFFDSSSPDLVQQGTKCGDNKACIDTKCQSVELFNVQSCDQTCNNMGVCNSNDHCHCEEGWAPPYCAVRGVGGSIDSGPMKRTETATSPETTITQRSIVTEFQQSTQASPATSPGTMVTDKNITTQFQQIIQASPDWTAVIVAVVVIVSILLTLTAIFTYIFVKKAATKRSTTRGITRTSAEGNRVKFFRGQKVVQSQSPDIHSSTSLQGQLPNTIV